MIRVTPAISISRGELKETFIRSPGPGGQNVNKTSTAVQLRFDVRQSASLPADVRERLVRIVGRRIAGGGVLVIEAHRYRTRERNRQDARERLIALIRRAALRPPSRRPSRPGRAAVERRLKEKRRRQQAKLRRRPVSPGED